MLEKMLAVHCAPAMAGIKPSNLMACKKSEIPKLKEEIERLNKTLGQKGIHIEVLCECERRMLLAVYRKDVLERHLNDSRNKAFLTKYGYGEAETICDYFKILKSRLGFDSFPHEIGVFLGYPLRDVHCFIKNRNKGCLLIGDWRVYHNVDEAKKTFCRYKACKAAVAKKVSDGISLAQIFCAV